MATYNQMLIKTSEAKLSDVAIKEGQRIFTEANMYYDYSDDTRLPAHDGEKKHTETFTGVTANTVTLTYAPVSLETVTFSINGVIYKGGTDYTLSGKVITWTATAENGGFDLTEDMSVIVEYTYKARAQA